MSRNGLLAAAGAAVVAGILALAACGKSPVESEGSNNPTFTVDLLFEHEGCKIYRFTDDWKYIYYSVCAVPSQVSWNEVRSAGKSTYRVPRQVSTELVTAN